MRPKSLSNNPLIRRNKRTVNISVARLTPPEKIHRVSYMANASDKTLGCVHNSSRLWYSRPRLSSAVVLCPVEDGVLIDGLARQEKICGPVAHTLLPRLLTLLDGSHTVAELGSMFSSLPHTYVESAVTMLADWGLLEQEDSSNEDIVSNENTVAFIHRCIASGFGIEGTTDACCRLRRQQICVVFTERIAAHATSLTLLLTVSGVNAVVLEDAQHLSKICTSEQMVIAVTDDDTDKEWYASLLAAQTTRGFSWLRVAVSASRGYADIGPLFDSAEKACYACFRSVHYCSSESFSSPLSESFDTLNTVSGFIALEVLTRLAVPGLSDDTRQFRRYQLTTWESHILSYPRLFGCHQCDSDQTWPNHCCTTTAIVYEQYVGLDSRATVSGRTAAVLFAQPSSHNEDGRTQFLVCDPIELGHNLVKVRGSVLQAILAVSDGAHTPIRLSAFASILGVAGGIRSYVGHSERRWAPTAGNLGSIELFVLVRNVEGLESGVYCYRADLHVLMPLRRRDMGTVGDFMNRAFGCVWDNMPDVLIIMVGHYQRLMRKYASFAYRLLHLDAGTAMSQLRMVANGLGIHSHLVNTWPDDLIEEYLHLRVPDVQISGLIALSRTSPISPTGRQRGFDAQPLVANSHWKHAHEYAALTVADVTEKLMRESRQTLEDLRVGPRPADVALLGRHNEKEEGVYLQALLSSNITAMAALELRRSTREFSETPVSLRHIGTILHYSHSADNMDWRVSCQQGLTLTYIVLARRVLRLEEGVYRYNPLTHSLIQQRDGLSYEEMKTLFVQPQYAAAPFVIWISGNLAAASSSQGGHGHRQLLFRAGAAGHRLWLASLGLGLSGSSFAGLIPGAARTLLDLDGYKRASLFAFAGGFNCC
jgi:SagB-type dehydrogenase family enzyme